MGRKAKKKTVVDGFIDLGLPLGGLEADEGQLIIDCPFCGKEDHFYVNAETGQWDCKVCGKSGNFITFMKEWCEFLHGETDESKFKELADDRGIPVKELKAAGVAWNPVTDEWLIPNYSDKGTVRVVHRAKPGKYLYACAFTKPILYGLDELAKAKPGCVVWLVEGHWDAIMMRWLLRRAGREGDVVVAVPGATTFHPEWVPWFRGRYIRICHDADQAGDQGQQKCGEMLKGQAKGLAYLSWADTLPDGWDLRDQITTGRRAGQRAAEILEEIEELLTPLQRRDPSRTAKPKPEPGKPKGKGGGVGFSDVLGVFHKWVKMDRDFEMGLALALGTCLANDVPGDPLWLYLVGPPGSGKTLILLSLQKSDRCVFRSSLTPAGLVSGFNTSPDPSLIPQLDGRCAIFKDGTELLAMHPDARREAYGILRGAFDGHVMKTFGNGVMREYFVHFNMLIGVTPKIHADNQATMGERFFKYEMKEVYAEDKIKQAMMNNTKEDRMFDALTDINNRFLDRTLEPARLPAIPDKFIDKMIALAQLVSILRAEVERNSFADNEIRYRPSYEVGTRVAKGLAKMSQMLATVYGVPEVDSKVYSIVHRVALDTMIGFHLDIADILMKRRQGLFREEITAACKIPPETLRRRLLDLEQLGVVRKEQAQRGHYKAGGLVPSRFVITEPMADLWERSTPNGAMNGNGKH